MLFVGSFTLQPTTGSRVSVQRYQPPLEHFCVYGRKAATKPKMICYYLRVDPSGDVELLVRVRQTVGQFQSEGDRFALFERVSNVVAYDESVINFIRKTFDVLVLYIQAEYSMNYNKAKAKNISMQKMVD
jgi:hypothetical protein